MPIKFPCPNCKLALRIDRKFAGRAGRCPSCSKKLTVPELQIVGPNRLPSDPTPDSESNSTPDSEPLEQQVPTKNARFEQQGQAAPSEGNSVIQELVSPTTNTVPLPRWVVLSQGALLGTVALTFFLFGMMVGSLTGSGQTIVDKNDRVTLSGSVFSDRDNRRIADMGAVVIILPVDASTDNKPNARLLRPASFKPIDNESKKIVEDAGGQVVRVNSDGMFTAIVEQNKKYQVLVISKNAEGNSNSDITKQMRAELGAFFLPLEELLDGQSFDWREVILTNNPLRMDVVLFK